MAALLLIHGGLWDGMDAERFWARPGVVAALEAAGHAVRAPDRLVRAPDWRREAAHLAPVLPDEPVTLVAGSNGCSVAVRLAVAFPDRVARLLLAWPATAADLRADAAASAELRRGGAATGTVDALLAGEALRGVTDAELTALDLPVGVVPSAPPNLFHQRRTVDRLLELVPGAVELPGCPESPRPEFSRYRAAFVAAVTGFVGR